MADLLFEGVDFIEGSVAVEFSLFNSLCHFLILGVSIHGQIASHDLNLLVDLLLVLSDLLSQVLGVNLFGDEVIEPVEHRVLSLLIQTLDHRIFDILDFILHGLDEIINILLIRLELLVDLDSLVLHLNDHEIIIIL